MTMKKFKVQSLKGKRSWGIRQYYWRVISNHNGRIILTSETYKNSTYVKNYAESFAKELGADYENLY